MRGLPTVIILVVLAGAAAVSAYQYNKHRTQERERAAAEDQHADDGAGLLAPTTPADKSVPQPPGEAKVKQAQPNDPQPAAPATPPKEKLSAAERAMVTAGLAAWRFEGGPSERSPADLAPADAELLAQWQLRRAFVQHAARLEPQLPARLQRIELANGNTMWGTSALRNGNRWDVVLLTGIKSSLPADRVRSVSPQARAAYLDATKADYEEEIAELQSGSAGDLIGAFALAQRRGDQGQYESLFELWRKADGPARLASVLPDDRRSIYAASLAILAPETAEPTIVRNDPPKRHNTTRAPQAQRPPRDLDDLAKKVSKVRLKRRMSSDEHTRLLEQLLRWDEWLDKQEKRGNASEQPRIDAIRQRLSVLRLDLLKSSGFGD
ncbi:MAG: hypothetical protein AAF581_07400 [Planctomycetota bacterium]